MSLEHKAHVTRTPHLVQLVVDALRQSPEVRLGGTGLAARKVIHLLVQALVGAKRVFRCLVLMHCESSVGKELLAEATKRGEKTTHRTA